uniref:Acetyltransferase n=1 Tax=uncultured Muribaculaceae bacterium TaxID=2301481 RepID=A0A6G8F3U9_9BACT|nr:acetyltransferase [uncultured Muribaculaceae bacterium]
MTESTGSSLASRLFNTLFAAIGSLPLGVLYGLSDIVALFAGGIVGYRRKVIRRNLAQSFPEKSKKELRKIEKGFYRFLGDYFVETLKLGRMSEKQIMRRMKFENIEELNSLLRQGHNVSILLGHYCNWEWMSSIPLHLPEGIPGGQIYHPLENEAADQAFLKIRNRFGAVSIKMKDTLQTLLKWKREGRNSIIGYIADQIPIFEGIHMFTDFLNHDTAVFTGHERISRMLHAAVFYCEMSRPKRGEYVCRFVKITDDAASLPQFEVTRRYMQLLEQSIIKRPEFWLWSHNRWKRGRADFFDRFGEEEAKKRLERL